MRLTQSLWQANQNPVAAALATLIIFFLAPLCIHEQSNAYATDALLEPRLNESAIESSPERTDSQDGANLAPPLPDKMIRPRSEVPLMDLAGEDKALAQPKALPAMEFSKEVLRHPKVRYFIDRFSKHERPYLEHTLARAGRYLPMIAAALNDAGLPQELAYLALVESAFQTDAKSPKGAVGIWQFMPATGREYGLRIDQWVDERRDPEKATRAAAAYLKELHDYYGRWYLATAAYNAGPGTIDRALQSSRAKDFWGLKNRIRQETRDYVPKFVALATIASQPEQFGLSQISYDAPLNYEEIELSAPIKLEALAKLTAEAPATLRELNPALVRQRTPPGMQTYRVKVPVGKAAVYAERMLDKENQQSRRLVHRVRKGETLASIARQYGFTPQSLVELNGLTSARLRIGQKLNVTADGLRLAMK